MGMRRLERCLTLWLLLPTKSDIVSSWIDKQPAVRRRSSWQNGKTCSSRSSSNNIELYKTCQFSTRASLGIGDGNDIEEKQQKRNSPHQTAAAPPFKFRYRIEKSHTVQQNGHGTRSILALLVKYFDFSSSSQARNACRNGAILILRKNDCDEENYKEAPNGGSSSKKSLLQADWFDDGDSSSSLWEQRHAISVNALTIVRAEDIVVRITHLAAIDDDCWYCYPVEQTGYVQPPENLYKLWPEVLFQDNHIAIVNKPEGLTTIGVVARQDDLQSLLPFILQPPPLPATTKSSSIPLLPRPVHRLDFQTSGLVVVAKSQEALERLSVEFADERQHVHQTYTVLVVGQVHQNNNDTGTIDYYPMDGKEPAMVSQWRVLRRGQYFTLLEVRPIATGYCCHQIRWQLSYGLKTPIVGDDEYGHGKFKEFRQQDDGGGLFLCSNAISFHHPMTGEELTFEVSKLPAKFQEFLDKEQDILSSFESINNTLQDYIDMVKVELQDQFSTNEGVSCTGEPPIDPSRMINPNQGDSEWMDDW